MKHIVLAKMREQVLIYCWWHGSGNCITSEEGNIHQNCVCPLRPSTVSKNISCRYIFTCRRDICSRLFLEVLFLIVKIENNLNILKKAWLNNLLGHPNNEMQYHAAVKRKRHSLAERERYIDIFQKTRCRTACVRCFVVV